MKMIERGAISQSKLMEQVPSDYVWPKCPTCHETLLFIDETFEDRSKSGWRYACRPCEHGHPNDGNPAEYPITNQEASWIIRHGISTPKSRQQDELVELAKHAIDNAVQIADSENRLCTREDYARAVIEALEPHIVERERQAKVSILEHIVRCVRAYGEMDWINLPQFVKAIEFEIETLAAAKVSNPPPGDAASGDIADDQGGTA